MIPQLLLALALAIATVVVHTVGIVKAVLPCTGIWSFGKNRGADRGPIVTLSILVCGLLMLHLVEMALWGAMFSACGIFTQFEASLYYSLTSYTTVGYGDVLPTAAWRLMGPMEATVGVLMLGMSTSVVVAAVQHLHKAWDKSRLPTNSTSD